MAERGAHPHHASGPVLRALLESPRQSRCFHRSLPGRVCESRLGYLPRKDRSVFRTSQLRRFLFRRGSSENRSILDRKSTRLNSSHITISYAVFCLKKKKKKKIKNIITTKYKKKKKTKKKPYNQLNKNKIFKSLKVYNITT